MQYYYGFGLGIMVFICGSLVYEEEVRDTDPCDRYEYSEDMGSEEFEEVESFELDDELED